MNKEEKTITLGNELYEEFIEGKQTIDTHELLNLFAKRINNLQSKIDKAVEILNDGLKQLDERNRCEVYIEEYLENARDILKEDK